MREYKNAELGQLGGKEITGTSAVTATANGYFYALSVISDAVVTAQSNFTGADNPNLPSFTAGISAGIIVYGKFTSITLSSGSMIGYYGD